RVREGRSSSCRRASAGKLRAASAGLTKSAGNGARRVRPSRATVDSGRRLRAVAGRHVRTAPEVLRGIAGATHQVTVGDAPHHAPVHLPLRATGSTVDAQPAAGEVGALDRRLAVGT